jgi:hypothetical protein
MTAAQRHFLVMLFFLAALVFFVLASLVAGDVVTWAIRWFAYAGLSSAALAVLVYLYQGRGGSA